MTSHEAKTNLLRHLAEVEGGAEIVTARGRKRVAVLVPYAARQRQERPKVGELAGKSFHVPKTAFAPVSAKDLWDWKL